MTFKLFLTKTFISPFHIHFCIKVVESIPSVFSLEKNHVHAQSAHKIERELPEAECYRLLVRGELRIRPLSKKIREKIGLRGRCEM